VRDITRAPDAEQTNRQQWSGMMRTASNHLGLTAAALATILAAASPAAARTQERHHTSHGSIAPSDNDADGYAPGGYRNGRPMENNLNNSSGSRVPEGNEGN